MRSLACESETLCCGNKTYRLDEEGFLVNPDEWDEGFAEAMAPQTGIHRGLTPAHWEVIHYIRNTFRDSGRCPLVYEIAGLTNCALPTSKGFSHPAISEGRASCPG